MHKSCVIGPDRIATDKIRSKVLGITKHSGEGRWPASSSYAIARERSL